MAQDLIAVTCTVLVTKPSTKPQIITCLNGYADTDDPKRICPKERNPFEFDYECIKYPEMR